MVQVHNRILDRIRIRVELETESLESKKKQNAHCKHFLKWNSFLLANQPDTQIEYPESKYKKCISYMDENTLLIQDASHVVNRNRSNIFEKHNIFQKY